MLSSIPSLCIDIMDKYHDDWFPEIIMIIAGMLRYTLSNGFE